MSYQFFITFTDMAEIGLPDAMTEIEKGKGTASASVTVNGTETGAIVIAISTVIAIESDHVRETATKTKPVTDIVRDHAQETDAIDNTMRI